MANKEQSKWEKKTSEEKLKEKYRFYGDRYSLRGPSLSRSNEMIPEESGLYPFPKGDQVCTGIFVEQDPVFLASPAHSLTEQHLVKIDLALTQESDPLSWHKDEDQILLTGDKSGSFDLTTTGIIISSNLSGINTGDETKQSIEDKLLASNTTNNGYLSSEDYSIFSNTVSNVNSLSTTYLKLDQTIPQTTAGTFEFSNVIVSTIDGGINANDDIIIQGTTNITRTDSYVILQPSGGNVGIGTNAPSAKLDIRGGNIAVGTVGDARSISTYGYFYGERGDVNPIFWAQRTATAGNWQLRLLSNDYAQQRSIGHDFADASGNSYMRVTNSGRVGIGTTAPLANLHVSSSGGSNSLASGIGNPPLFVDSGANLYNAEFTGKGAYTGFLVTNSTVGGRPFFQFYNNANSKTFTQQLETNGDFSIREGTASGTIRFVIKVTTGNVGIGTSNPDKALEINSPNGNNLRLTYNDSNGSATYYTDLLVDSTGNLTITPVGGRVTVNGDIVGRNLISEQFSFFMS